MTKVVDLLRHTAADGDVLTEEGVRAALTVGARLEDEYELAISSGAQRATQTLACVLVSSGKRVPGGVVVDTRFRSSVEDRWKTAYEKAGAGDLRSFEKADPDLVKQESDFLGRALAEVFDALPEGGRALVVGHSPTQEAAVYGLTGEVTDPLGKGEGIRVTRDNGNYEIHPLD